MPWENRTQLRGKETAFGEGGGLHGVRRQRGHTGEHVSAESTGKVGARVSESADRPQLGPLQNPVRRWKPEVQGLTEGLVMGLLRVSERLKAELAPQTKMGAVVL